MLLRVSTIDVEMKAGKDTSINMNKEPSSHAEVTLSDINHVLVTEEREGRRLTVKGRVYSLIVVAATLFLVVPFPEVLYYEVLIFLFILIGLLAHDLQNRPWFRPWHLYLFIFIDFALLTFTVTFPNPFAETLFPPQFAYRNSNVVYLFLLLGGLAFSYRPKYVLWGGVAGTCSWTLGLVWVLSQPETVSILTVDDSVIRANPIDFIENIFFVDLGGRLQEIVVFLCISGFLATIVYRSRSLVFKQIKSERDRYFVREHLGKYVPRTVASAIIRDHGFLKPKRHRATIVFADLEGFTFMVESTDAEDVFAILNEYFAELGNIIVEHGGVINQFQGDAILATFNLPVELPDHANAALAAAQKIRDACETKTYHGRSLRARIGIATGEVIAGSVGSNRQLVYTVHGDQVNLAARLEQMNKTTGSQILMSQSTFDEAGCPPQATHIGEIPIRGRSAENVYSL